MALRTCEYCGTEFDAKLRRCPLCGKTGNEEAQAPAQDKKKAKKRKEDRIPLWMWALICSILALAVLIGLVAFILHMGYFDESFDLSGESLIEQVDDTPKQTEQQQEPVPEQTDSKACTALTISQDTIILDELGEKVFLTAVARPSDCEDEIVFTSSDEEVVSVTGGGMITAVAPGTAEVVVTCGEITQICEVTCDFELPEEEEPEETENTEEEETEQTTEETEQEKEPEPAAAPEVTPSDFTLFYPGEEAYLTVSNVPEGAAVTYVSSNASVVTVTADGKVTAVGNGQATITVTVADVKLTSIARCNLQSTTEGGETASSQSYTGPFTLSHSDVTLFFTGDAFTIALTDAAGKTVTGLNWTSSNTAVCTASGSTIKAAGSGQATVSVTYGGTTYSCIVRCSY